MGLDQTMMLCPRCGSINLHHTAMEIHSRVAEDAGGTITRVTCAFDWSPVFLRQTASVQVQQAVASELWLSDRRDGYRVEFFCEVCHGRFALDTWQHKGTTFTAWEALEQDKRAVALKRRAAKYGLELDALWRLLQQATCDICKKSFEFDRDKCIDHDHVTGVVRGVLHIGCNTGLGHLERFNDLDEEGQDRLIEYLKRGKV